VRGSKLVKIWGLGFGIRGLEFGVWGFGFWVLGLEFGVQDYGFRV
jgi:hypothetical protein